METWPVVVQVSITNLCLEANNEQTFINYNFEIEKLDKISVILKIWSFNFKYLSIFDKILINVIPYNSTIEALLRCWLTKMNVNKI